MLYFQSSFLVLVGCISFVVGLFLVSLILRAAAWLAFDEELDTTSAMVVLFCMVIANVVISSLLIAAIFIFSPLFSNAESPVDFVAPNGPIGVGIGVIAVLWLIVVDVKLLALYLELPLQQALCLFIAFHFLLSPLSILFSSLLFSWLGGQIADAIDWYVPQIGMRF